MVTRIVAAVDAEYVEVTRARIKRAFRQLALEGRPNGGRVFGYLPGVGPDGRRTRKIVPHEAEAIRWAAAEVLRGETLASIARAFDARGLSHVKKGRHGRRRTSETSSRTPPSQGCGPTPTAS